jgi:hypothetical protein
MARPGEAESGILYLVETVQALAGDAVVVERLRKWRWARRSVVLCVVLWLLSLVWVSMGASAIVSYGAFALVLGSILAMAMSKSRAMQALPEAAKGWSWRVLHHRVNVSDALPVRGPWRLVDDPESATLLGELQTEIGPGHPLSGVTFSVVRECSTCGEVLVRRDDTTFALVRPTGSAHPESLPLPRMTPLGGRASAELAMLAHANDHPRASTHRSSVARS